MKILCIAGARPNFVKIAPLHRAFTRRGAQCLIVHTGQHSDPAMSQVFFHQLELPPPAYNLGVSEATQIRRTARIMIQIEEVLEQEKPDLVVVVGDVDSTLAGALAAAQWGAPLAHVEAGLRSGDRSMPEENNRILTDHLSDYLFATEQSALQNLAREGISPEKTHLAGNVMIDSLVYCREKASALTNLDELGLEPGDYILATLHRPSNADSAARLQAFTRILDRIAPHKKIVFPVHPRTAKNAKALGLFDSWRKTPGLLLLPPQGYLEFLNLLQHALLSMSDSGGVQEECAYLQIPCLTLRDTTERPLTVESGASRLLPDLDADQAYHFFLDAREGRWEIEAAPPLWDGGAAERIGEVLVS